MPILIQLLLGVTVLLATFMICVAGVQVFHILSEFRLVLKRLNKILDNTQTISTSSAKPIAAVNQFFSEVKTLVNETQDEIIESTPDRVISAPKSDTTSRRFFKRGGQFLRPS